jgi:YD repeat-containing protein
MRRLSLALFVALMLFPALIDAQQSPNDERGVTPGKSYLMGELDVINTFNGNLNVTIPIGQSFRVNGALSYSFALHYGGNAWDFGTHEVYPPTSATDRPPVQYSYAFPARGNNAGMGWRLTLGEFFPHGTNPFVGGLRTYVAPDGGQHVFTGKLHEVDPNEPPGAAYTTDGTYLRLTTATTSPVTYRIEFPNGLISTFDSDGHLTETADRFGNWMRVAYGTQIAGDPYPASEKWDVSDSLGRHHYVYFRPSVSYMEGDDDFSFPPANGHTMIDRVEIAAFGGNRATYQFNYDGVPNAQTFISRRCGTDRDVSKTTSISLLSSVVLPGNFGQYSITYDKGDQQNCSSLWMGSDSTFSGNLRSMTTPINTTFAYTYAPNNYPSPTGDNAYDLPVHNWAAAVRSRIVTAPAPGATATTEILSNTTYNTELGDLSGINGTQELVRQVERRSATGSLISATRHYFTKCASTQLCTYAGEYGLPFTRYYRSPGAGGPFLSTEEYEPVNVNGILTLTMRRSTWVRYEADRILTSNPLGSTSNARPAYNKTIYEDGKFADETLSEFDGLGHYRKAVTGGTFTAGNQKTTYTAFNPGRGIFGITSSGAMLSTFAMLPTSSPWILNTFTNQTVREANKPTLTTNVCFDTNGFVTSRRALQSTSATPAESANDLLAVFVADAQGNLSSERYWGGDNPNVAGTHPLAATYTPAPTALVCGAVPSGEAFRIDHTYANSAHQTATYFEGNNQSATFRNVQNVVDSVGLVSQSVERAVVGSSGGASDGLKTDYSYDLLGRLKDVTPLSPSVAGITRGAATRYTYSMQPPKLTVEARVNGVAITQTVTEFDGLGRPRFETMRLPGGGTTTRETRYDTAGRTVAVSEPGSSTHLTAIDYDWLDRVTKITRPDGASDSRGYTGVAAVTRTATVQTPFGPTDVTTTEQYDRQGRLVRVIEPNAIATAYDYDSAGKLSSVCMKEIGGTCGQLRTFNYDGRGLLTSEVHPETGPGGNGATSYRYDSRGHTIRKTIDGTPADKFDTSYLFDREERLVGVYEAGTARPLKAFSFGTSNGATNYSNGQLIQSIRYNWMLPPPGQTVLYAFQATENFTRGERDGGVSVKRTYVTSCVVDVTHDCRAAATGTIINDFTQSFEYDELGATKTLNYPTCLSGCGTTTLPARTVTNQRSEGLLTSVAWGGAESASFAYSLSGMLSTIQRSSGVTDLLSYKEAMPSRLQSISTSGTNSATCVAPTFSQQPGSQTITVGSALTLSALASGETGSITYQWYQKTGSTWSVFGAASLSSTLTTYPSQTTSYKVNASNSCGNRDSDTAVVTLCTGPSVVSLSPNQTITRGQTIPLSVSAAGSSPFEYQWYDHSTGSLQLIPGATASALSVAPSTTSSYTVRITNPCGSVTSTDVVVTVVNAPTAPSAVNAHWSAGSAVEVTWGASTTQSGTGIARYEVERINDGAVINAGVPSPLRFADPSALLGKAYAYRVRAVDGNGIAGPYSIPDLTVTMTFADDPVYGAAAPQGATLIRGIHIGDLRRAVDAVRGVAHLSPVWSSYAAATGLIFAEDVASLRSVLAQARTQLGLSNVTFTNVVQTNAPIRAADINELRSAVK